ncbi:HEAT repeat-containing protein 6 isoform X2 [Mangifera indica]|uniref:HEAT repeat-containing protein 6 isoform X2 n=1 Tax=Mangifera indica TaxID=29780 RepID=UPI001CFB9682|nr:HEAT repeat-containing protein 6 isoform X2 [Mangifera indica]
MASSSSVRSWRTAFLTLRDETSSGAPAGTSTDELVHNLIFANSHSLISAASDLPPYEVTSDVLFLLELVANVNASACRRGEDITQTLTLTSHLVHSIFNLVSFEFNSSSFTVILDSFQSMVAFFFGQGVPRAVISPNATKFKPVMECLETIRRVTSVYQGKFSPLESIQLIKFLLHILECFHPEFVYLYNSNANNSRSTAETGKRFPGFTCLWDVHTIAFTMLADAFSSAGSFFPFDIWHSTIEVLRKVMDVFASKSVLVEGSILSRFYLSLLHCLHLVLTDPKGSLSDHVSGFVAALKLFFVYGLNIRPQVTSPSVGNNMPDLVSHSLTMEESKKEDKTPYRPPHLRKKDLNIKWPKAQDSRISTDHETSTVDFTSSDSDYSDSDGSLKGPDCAQSSKVRVAAIVCLQDLCQADPKSFTTQWTILLPTNDVLRPRKFEATLMSCLLFDPYLKARMASASTLVAMMDGPSSVFLQVAEYKESFKYGSFMALSSSLGQILMQLHSGIVYLIQRETHDRLLTSLFKILMLLISCTPYSRMPGELLPRVITSLRLRVEEGFPLKNDQTGLLAAAISCLTAALSTSPSLPQVKEMFLEEISTGSVDTEMKPGVLSTLFQCSERLTSPTVCFEALQALRAVSHNYPNIMLAFWKHVSTIVFRIVKASTAEVPTKTWKGNVGSVGFIGEKVITAAIKVLDECLRAISGFKGTEDLLDDKLLDTPFTSDCIRTKKISSAPLYEQGSPEDTREEAKASHSGSEQWSETIEKHMPLILQHTSAMVRTATVTCFAGITSSVFISLAKEAQDFIISSVINAALHDEVPSVRSAACRAIGVISCFPKISHSAEILGKFIHAVEINTSNPLVSVRITASWALANICDSLRHCIDDFPLKPSPDKNVNSQMVESLTECALHLTKDGDKIKSNAVRALGNLARFVKYKSSSCVHANSSHPACLGDSLWLERMVQAFLSCVTTGNVKVQWNVCHALSNLFLNETLNLQHMDWAPSVFSILLLLLRDSSNFKIRIQAAAALAVPSSVRDYGNSFSDVIQGLEHILENLGSEPNSAPSSFKYRVALEKQLTSTMLHALSLASSSDHHPLKDFLVKKASFLEEWFKVLCSSLVETACQPESENNFGNQKKEMISKAMRSLIKVYEGRNQHSIAKKFEMLDNNIW